MPKKKKKSEVSANVSQTAEVEKPQEIKKNKRSKSKLLLILLAIIFGLLALGLFMYFWFDRQYENKFFPNVYIGQNSVAGKTYLDALNQQDTTKAAFENSGLVFNYQDHKVTVPTTIIADESSGISTDILTIDSQSTVDQAYELGRRHDRFNSFLQRIQLLLMPKHVSLAYTLNEEELKSYLNTSFSKYENKAVNAQLSFTDNGEIEVLPEKAGQAFDWDKILTIIKNNIANGDNQELFINLETDNPKITQDDAEPLIAETESLLSLAPLTLKWEDKTWSIDKTTLQTWLAFGKEGLVFDEKNVTDYLQTNISPDINQAVKEGKFSLNVNSDKTIAVTQFQQGEDGRELKINKTIDQLQQKFIQENNTQVEVIVEVAKPKATPDNMADLGIKELLGTGQTNFSNSPYNRIKNISKGADILNGLLIAPGETFSLINALGHIDGENGWLPELVIKENKTIPEFGGGLCQIGTTSFRAAMMSGLPIVERQNHSYVVSYYNYNGKPGVDATIYEPKPDFRFMNDTGHYILWRSRIEGSEIYFEFWGTSDGRQGSFTEPTNYNYVSQPAPIITEVDNLAPGEMVCSEHGHTGISAAFDYIIKRADGTEDKVTFTSVYKALPQVCNKGKEKTTAIEPSTNTNSNSNNNTNSNTNSSNSNKNKKQP